MAKVRYGGNGTWDFALDVVHGVMAPYKEANFRDAGASGKIALIEVLPCFVGSGLVFSCLFFLLFLSRLLVCDLSHRFLCDYPPVL